jgi:hypothetical protein
MPMKRHVVRAVAVVTTLGGVWIAAGAPIIKLF